MTILYTSLIEIRSYNPCSSGWRDIYAAQCIRNLDKPFPLIDCLDSNPTLDVLWLLGMRKTEVSIAVETAQRYVEHIEAHGVHKQPALSAYWEACKSHAKNAINYKSPFLRADAAMDCVRLGHRMYVYTNQNPELIAKQILRAEILSYQSIQ